MEKIRIQMRRFVALQFLPKCLSARSLTALVFYFPPRCASSSANSRPPFFTPPSMSVSNQPSSLSSQNYFSALNPTLIEIPNKVRELQCVATFIPSTSLARWKYKRSRHDRSERGNPQRNSVRLNSIWEFQCLEMRSRRQRTLKAFQENVKESTIFSASLLLTQFTNET